MTKFIVTIQRTTTTIIEVDATCAARAREYVENYGVAEAAVDMASQDDGTDAFIKSIRKAPRDV